jgi:hypothetical protein
MGHSSLWFHKETKMGLVLGHSGVNNSTLSGVFPAIPAMDGDLPTPTLIVFALAAILWFGMLLIGGISNELSH